MATSSSLLLLSPSPKTSSFSSPHLSKPFRIRCVSSSLGSSKKPAVLEKSNTQFKSGTWQWKFEDNPVNVYYEEHEGEDTVDAKSILMIPTISDVSTVEEWREVAKDIVKQNGGLNWRATIVDWPGLGYSDRPTLDYNADVMENFLIQFMNAPNSPLSSSGNLFVSFGYAFCGILKVEDFQVQCYFIDFLGIFMLLGKLLL